MVCPETSVWSAGRFCPAVWLMAAVALAGCMPDPGVSRAAGSAHSPAVAAPQLDRQGQVVSPLVQDLRERRSVLPPGSTFATVAGAVLTSVQAAAESELRVKRLTAQARSRNWLPRLGPDISLSSLGSIAAQLVMDQALLDNGRRKAERDFAAADVEVAAVTLATDLNQRVHDGLKLYVEAQRAGELAALTETALARMAEFERIMRIRVDGGLSDGSELRLLAQKKAEMAATLASERQGRETALAELAAMTGRPMDDQSGLTILPQDAGTPEPLSVMMARAEAARTEAEARIARAGLMPGFGASAGVDKSGALDAGISLDGEGLGFGRKSQLQAIAETQEVARRRVEETARDSERRIVVLLREIADLTAQEAQDGAVLAEMDRNLTLFTQQYKAGRRSLVDLAAQFETYTRMQRDHATIKYRIALARLEIARERGVLLDGGAM